MQMKELPYVILINPVPGLGFVGFPYIAGCRDIPSARCYFLKKSQVSEKSRSPCNFSYFPSPITILVFGGFLGGKKIGLLCLVHYYLKPFFKFKLMESLCNLGDKSNIAFG